MIEFASDIVTSVITELDPTSSNTLPVIGTGIAGAWGIFKWLVKRFDRLVDRFEKRFDGYSNRIEEQLKSINVGLIDFRRDHHELVGRVHDLDKAHVGLEARVDACEGRRELNGDCRI